jgi:hypothetical protein
MALLISFSLTRKPSIMSWFLMAVVDKGPEKCRYPVVAVATYTAVVAL